MAGELSRMSVKLRTNKTSNFPEPLIILLALGNTCIILSNLPSFSSKCLTNVPVESSVKWTIHVQIQSLESTLNLWAITYVSSLYKTTADSSAPARFLPETDTMF